MNVKIPEGWVEWFGGEQPPVNPNSIPSIILRNGHMYQPGIVVAEELDWRHLEHDADIIGFQEEL